MARTRSISSIDTEIAKLQAELNKAQEKCDSIAARILELQNQKQLAEAKQVMDASWNRKNNACQSGSRRIQGSVFCNFRFGVR